MAEGPLVGVVKRPANRFGVALRQPILLEGYGHVVPLACVAHLRGVLDDGALHRQAGGFPFQPSRGLAADGMECLGQRRRVQIGEVAVHGLHEVALQVGLGRAQGAQRARHRRNEYAIHIGRFRDQRGHQWPGTAVGHHSEAGQVHVATRQDAGGFSRQHGGCDLYGAVRHLLGRQADLAAHHRQGLAPPFRLQFQAATERAFGIQQSGDQKGIRHGGNLAVTQAVAGGPGVRAGAFRADLQGSGGVRVDDRAAARADGGNGNRGHQNGEVGHPFLSAQHRTSASHHADVGTGAAHVQGHQIRSRPTGIGGRRGGPGHACGRPRQQRGHRTLSHGGEQFHAAVGARAARWGAHAALRHSADQQRHLAFHRRANVGVDQSQGGALKLPGLGPHIRGQLHRQSRQRLFDGGPGYSLMGGIPVAVQEADH